MEGYPLRSRCRRIEADRTNDLANLQIALPIRTRRHETTHQDGEGGRRRASLTLSVMPEEGKKNNDRKGYPEQPQKRASAKSHLNLLLIDEQQRRRSVAVPKGAMDLWAASRTSCGGKGG